MESPEYSPDVESDHTGKMVFARDIAKGETIRVPLHMMLDRERGREIINLALSGKRKP